MSLNLATLLRESAKNHPAKPAIYINDTVLPYGMVDGFAQRFAGALHQLGVRGGQHVALMMPNVPQFTIAYSRSYASRTCACRNERSDAAGLPSVACHSVRAVDGLPFGYE